MNVCLRVAVKWQQDLWLRESRLLLFPLFQFSALWSAEHDASASCIWWSTLLAQMVQNLPATHESRVQSLGWENPLEKGVATHSSILGWRISWTEEPGRLQFMGSQRVVYSWANSTFILTSTLNKLGWGKGGLMDSTIIPGDKLLLSPWMKEEKRKSECAKEKVRS